MLKLGQNKKGQKFFQLHRFLNTFLQLAAEKKYSKNGSAGNFFGPPYFVTALRSRTCLCMKCKCNVIWVLAPLQNIIIKRIYIPTAPLLAVYIFFRDPSGCLAWYIQKYLLCPLSDKTVPIQFLGFIFISLGSGNVKFNIFLYHGSPKNNGNAQLLR